jgi:hypothetical protein
MLMQLELFCLKNVMNIYLLVQFWYSFHLYLVQNIFEVRDKHHTQSLWIFMFSEYKLSFHFPDVQFS